MNFYVLTLFPEMITGGLCHSIIKRATDANLININCVNIRDFSGNKHKRVDDYPYGGGAGMVIRPQPVYEAYEFAKKASRANNPRVLYMTPQGKRFTQNMAWELSKEICLIFLCGHYEGIDERVIDEIVTDEISIGDYILTGGELAAMTIIDAVSRLIPNVLGNGVSTSNESFSNNLLEYPQYTRPPVFMGRSVPNVLLSGHHANVDKWREEKSLERTRKKRPDLLT